MTIPFSTAGDQFITITSNNEEVVSFGFEKGVLRFLPDIRSCVMRLFEAVVLNPIPQFSTIKGNWSISCGQFSIKFNVTETQFFVVWDGEFPPPEFVAFQQEFNLVRDRLLKIKAFW